LLIVIATGLLNITINDAPGVVRERIWLVGVQDCFSQVEVCRPNKHLNFPQPANVNA